MALSNQYNFYAPSFGNRSANQTASGGNAGQPNGWQDVQGTQTALSLPGLSDSASQTSDSTGQPGNSWPGYYPVNWQSSSDSSANAAGASSSGHAKGKHHRHHHHHHHHHHGKHNAQGQSGQANGGYGSGTDPNSPINSGTSDPQTPDPNNLTYNNAITGADPSLDPGTIDPQSQTTDNSAQTSTVLSSSSGSTSTADNGVKLGVPAYSNPGDSQGFWNQIQQAKPGSIFIMNPNSGPGDGTDASYKAAVEAAHAKGVKIYGYVSTQYGNRSASDVMNDVQSYKNDYGVDGIFLDEAALDSGHVGQYSDAIHAQGMEVAFNPGEPDFDPSAVNMADHIMNFEGSYSDYQNAQFPSWTQNAPADKFWNVIYGAPSNVNVQDVLNMAQSKHAGLVYVTDDSGANPYDQAPSFWNSELNLTA